MFSERSVLSQRRKKKILQLLPLKCHSENYTSQYQECLTITAISFLFTLLSYREESEPHTYDMNNTFFFCIRKPIMYKSVEMSGNISSGPNESEYTLFVISVTPNRYLCIQMKYILTLL